jgi:hypothetical protein
MAPVGCGEKEDSYGAVIEHVMGNHSEHLRHMLDGHYHRTGANSLLVSLVVAAVVLNISTQFQLQDAGEQRFDVERGQYRFESRRILDLNDSGGCTIQLRLANGNEGPRLSSTPFCWWRMAVWHELGDSIV